MGRSGEYKNKPFPSSRNNLQSFPTLGGDFSVDGRFVTTINCKAPNSTCTIPVPAQGFALVFLSNLSSSPPQDPYITMSQDTKTFSTSALVMVPPGVLATSNGHSGDDRERFGNTNVKNSSLLGDAKEGFWVLEKGCWWGWLKVELFLDGRLRFKDRVPTAVAHGYIYLKKPFWFGLIPDYRSNTNIRSTLLSLAISLLVFLHSFVTIYIINVPYYYNNFLLFESESSEFKKNYLHQVQWGNQGWIYHICSFATECIIDRYSVTKV